MTFSPPAVAAWLYRRAENVLAAMLALMFAAFVLQIAFRYLLNFSTGWTNEASLILWIWLVLFSIGFALPNAPAVALARHGEMAGTAAALLGAVQFGTGALISPVVGVLGNDSVAMATVIAGGLLLSLLVLLVVVRPWQLADLEPAAVPVG